MAKFKVLAGGHREGGKTYRRGDIVESNSNLLKMNRGSRKFAKVTDEEAAAMTAVVDTSDELAQMTKEQLKSFADENGIPLKGNENKQQLLDVIRKAME